MANARKYQRAGGVSFEPIDNATPAPAQEPTPEPGLTNTEPAANEEVAPAAQDNGHAQPAQDTGNPQEVASGAGTSEPAAPKDPSVENEGGSGSEEEPAFDFLKMIYSEEGEGTPTGVSDGPQQTGEGAPDTTAEELAKAQQELEASQTRIKELEQELKAKSVPPSTSINHPLTAHVAQQLEQHDGDAQKVIRELANSTKSAKGYTEKNESGGYKVSNEEVLRDYVVKNYPDMDDQERNAMVESKLEGLNSDDPRSRAETKDLIQAYRQKLGEQEKEELDGLVKSNEEVWHKSWQEQKQRQDQYRQAQQPVIQGVVEDMQNNDQLKNRYGIDDTTYNQVTNTVAQTLEEWDMAGLLARLVGKLEWDEKDSEYKFMGLDPDKILQTAYMVSEPGALLTKEQQEAYRKRKNKEIQERMKRSMTAQNSNPSLGDSGRMPVSPKGQSSGKTTIPQASPTEPQYPGAPRQFRRQGTVTFDQ